MSSVEKEPKVDAEVDSDEEDNDAPPPLEVQEKVEDTEDTTLANSDVVTKYQEASRIVQAALIEISALCVAGAKLLDICKAGDSFILEKTGAIYRGKGKNGKPIEKGIAFPVCVSVNEYVCHYSPLLSEDKLPELKDGDSVKIDIGVHVDGYIAVGAHTIIVGHVPNTETPIMGPRADVLSAAWMAAECCVRLIKPGNSNTAVTEAIKKVAEFYGVKCMAGMQMNQMKRYVIDGKKAIQLRDDDEKVEACTFDPYEVYCVDIAMSTGEGRPRQTDLRTTVYKRNVEQKYGLKIKASRQFFNDVNKKFPTMPFSLRYLEAEGSVESSAIKMGVRECVNHQLISAYPVLAERPTDHVVHVKFTVLLQAGGTLKVTGLDMPAGFSRVGPLDAEGKPRGLPDDITALLAVDEAQAALDKKKAKKKAARKAASGKKGSGAAEGSEEEKKE